MNKTELVEKIAVQSNITKKETVTVVNTMLKVIASELKNDQKIQLVGFGSFGVKKRAARQGKNPRTGEVVTIPATKTVGFKPGKELKGSLNK